MLRALSRFLSGRDILGIGPIPAAMELPPSGALVALGALNGLARPVQERAYAASGWAEAIPQRKGRRRALGGPRRTDHRTPAPAPLPRNLDRLHERRPDAHGRSPRRGLAAADAAAARPPPQCPPDDLRGGDLAAAEGAGRALLATNPNRLRELPSSGRQARSCGGCRTSSQIPP